MGQEMPFGPLRKLPNLLMKEVVLWTGLNKSQRDRLLGYLHVPLDSYTLRGLRNCIAEPSIPKHANMGFVTNEAMYNRIQVTIREIAGKPRCRRSISITSPGMRTIEGASRVGMTSHWNSTRLRRLIAITPQTGQQGCNTGDLIANCGRSRDFRGQGRP